MTEITRECCIKYCTDEQFKNEYCKVHFLNYIRYGNPTYTERVPKPTVCIMDGCDNKPSIKGLCSQHYGRFLNKNNHPRHVLTSEICEVKNCKTKAAFAVDDPKNKGKVISLCRTHSRRLGTYGDYDLIPFTDYRKCRPGTKCSYKECDRGGYRQELCRMHFYRLFKYGDPSLESVEMACDKYIQMKLRGGVK